MRALLAGVLACGLVACILPREKIDNSAGGAGGASGAGGTGGKTIGTGGTTGATGTGGAGTGAGGKTTDTGGTNGMGGARGMIGGAGGGPAGMGGTAGSGSGGAGAGGAVGTGGVPSSSDGGAMIDASACDAPAGESGITHASVLDQCVLLLRMNEPNWTGAANEVRDSSGIGNNGTASPGANTESAIARFDRAGSFAGSGLVTVSNAQLVQETQALTLAAWINPSDIILGGISDAPGIITKRTNAAIEIAFAMFIYTDNYLYFDDGVPNERVHGNTVFQTNTWYHVAVVFDGPATGDRIRFYVNGCLDKTAPASAAFIPSSPAALLVGDLPGGGSTFHGIMDDVAIWTRALSDAEIAYLYSSPEEL